MRTGRPLAAFATIVLAAWAALGPPALAQVTHADPTDQMAGTALPSNPALAVDSARKRVASGDLAGAIRQLALYVAAHPAEVPPARYLGDLYYRSSDLHAAERTYSAILRYAANDRETHNRLGGVYAAEDRVAEAIDEFQKSLPSGGAYGHLVDLHRRLGDLPQFENDYRRAVETSPSDAAAQYAFGAVLRAERKTTEAVFHLERALVLEPNTCATLSELGSAYLDLYRTRSAIDVLQRCLVMSPDDYSALINVGDAFIEQDDYARARSVIQHANRLRPDGAEGLIDLGYLEDVGRQWQSAVAYYLKAIAVDPLARDAYVDLGYDYDEHHLYSLAEAAFLKGLSISPADGRLHYLLGVTYAEQGKRELARAEYRRATASDEPEVAKAATRDLSTLQ
ncbi:MAG: tetratricopeptide repeat protein [Candidatus Eremiobacteraeota bacterium]|nr:tetratricopeptide repeat protein [Candidatus Eremiobacteraeota bacterium]